MIARIEFDVDLTTSSSAKIWSLLANAVVMREACNLTSLVVTKQVETNSWKYEFHTVDGRHWTQVLFVPLDEEYQMTFEATDLWKLSEFVSHRPVCDAIAELIKNYGLSKLEIIWS